MTDTIQPTRRSSKRPRPVSVSGPSSLELAAADGFATKPKGRLTVDDIRSPTAGLNHATGAPVVTSEGKTGAVVWGRQRSRVAHIGGSPAEHARHAWHEAHRDEIIKFWKVYTKARGRGLPRKGQMIQVPGEDGKMVVRRQEASDLPDYPFTPITTVDEFFNWLLDEYGDELVVVRNMVDMPPEFEIPVRELGTWTGQVWTWRKWCRYNINPSIVLEMSAEALEANGEEATDFYNMVLDSITQAEMLPEIADKLGVGAMELTKFIRAYQKTHAQAKVEFHAALDTGLEWLTVRTHEEMEQLGRDGSDNLFKYNLLQQRLQNYRALVTKLHGSAYAAPATQKQTLKVGVGAGGAMRIDFTTGGGDDDVIDVLAYTPKETR